MTQARQDAALALIELFEVDALLLLGLVNIRYLSGFKGSDGALLILPQDRHLLCDSRYTLQASDEAELCTVAEYKSKSEGITLLLKKVGCKRVAFDAEKVTVSFLNILKTALPDVDFIPVADELDQLRAVKSLDEIKSISAAANLSSTAFNELLPLIKPGVSERSIALELEFIMKRSGAEEKAFDFIVASGYRGALPHARPTEKLLEAGEMVTIDFGARLDGYNSDETVTVSVGEPDKKLYDIYRIVKEAHDLAISAIRPGIECSSLDEIARSHINNCGYGDFFGHGLGHGVGLEVHEKPVISPRSRQRTQVGMVFTVEPGIYIPDFGGVRIEDLVQVTEEGCIILSKASKELNVC
ncbi:MAG: aminopeptidase P family protein [Geobacteraceae bacterium]|nr:aminopeptidase P family protein [Geobacteraceae bacterium]